MYNTAAIMNAGMDYLVEKLGAVETEIFISQISREPFDYTKWQREYYADFSVSELNKKAIAYAKSNPLKQLTKRGKASAGIREEG